MEMVLVMVMAIPFSCQVIAQRLSESKQTIPHYYLTATICADELLK